MKAIELVNRAWILSGTVSRGLQAVSEEQGTDGMFWLNQSLIEKNITGRQIPYYTEFQFNYVPDQETYIIPGLIKSDCLTFNFNQIRFSLYSKSRRLYQGEARANNISSLPVYYYEQRINGGCEIKFYFRPDRDYPCTITGRFELNGNLTPATELNTILDSYYQLYLMYDLAIYLCNWYKAPVPQMTQSKWMDLSRKVNDINYMDFSIDKVSTLSQRGALNYAVANLSNGFLPS